MRTFIRVVYFGKVLLVKMSLTAIAHSHRYLTGLLEMITLGNVTQKELILFLEGGQGIDIEVI